MFRRVGAPLILVVAALALANAAGASHRSLAATSFGSNVYVFDPSMTTSQIQATVDTIASEQVDNEFGSQRYALLFRPGTYGSASDPLMINVGYYTEVAGLGASPTDVTINGQVDVFNRCLAPDNCIALDNFWRSVSNLTINVAGGTGCRANTDFWAVSQASPMRRVNISGNLSFMDYCSAGPQFASGGFMADAKVTGNIVNGSQQQFFVRNSDIGGWSNGVWNQVFAGVNGAPAQSFPSPNPYTTLSTTPVSREAPYLSLDASGNYQVFAPSAQTASAGTTWANGPTPGLAIPISKFFIATPTDSAQTINAALGSGRNLILTPGIYSLAQPISVTRPDSIVLGLGFPTLIPTNGNAAITTASAKGILISGLIIDAGSTNSPVLMQIGSGHSKSDNEATDPSTLTDVFFRIGGANPGKATTSLVVNSNNAILDDIWAWRADHGSGVGWTSNTADTGLVVNGDNVTALGLFIEHFQKYEAIWNGNNGTDVFFQNEMPYDPPSQAAWMEASNVDGYAAFKVANGVTHFSGYGMASYCFFNQGIDIFAANAFEVPAGLPAGSFHDVLTRFLSGAGGIQNVINGTGGSVTNGNPGPANVVSYP